jgi:exonuclease VII large subunit
METYTVTELSNVIKQVVHSEFKGKIISVTGEISNTKRSGKHTYLTLKDDGASISVAFWGNSLDNPNGDYVEITGKIDYYARSGYINLIGSKIKSIGIGAIYAEYEKLKQEYEKKGYFNNKCDPPKSVKRIGVVTSDTGAALQDFIYALKNKGFAGDVYVYDCIVQGPKCPSSVAAGIKFFNSPFYCQLIRNQQSNNEDNENNEDNDDADDSLSIDTIIKSSASAFRSASTNLKSNHLYQNNDDDDTNVDTEVEVDLIIITRGGGSFEDLMGFSDPRVIDSIYNSKKYTVSAVGHEIDSMLSDYVANHREPTPSFAGDFVCRICDNRKKKLEHIEAKISSTKHDLLQTLYKYKNCMKRIDMSIENPAVAVELKLNDIYKGALSHINHTLRECSERMNVIREKIESNDISKILGKGFVAITNNKGNIMTEINDIVSNPTVYITNSSGKYKITIQKVKN